MATPQQQLTAKNVRGYSKEFLAAACACSHPRVDHVSRTKGCTRGCGCEKFAAAPPARAVSRDPREVFLLGTVGPSDPPAAEAEEETPTPVPAPAERAPEFPAVTPAEWEAGRRAVPPPEPAVAGTLVPRTGSATRCPFCTADDFETIPLLKCSSCKAWQHAACVSEHGKCAACNVAWPA